MMSTISLLLAIIMALMGFMPQMAQAHTLDQQVQQIKAASYSPQVINQPLSPTSSVSNLFQQGIGIDLQALLDATTDLTDTDSDGLPDSVEWVLGTDPENPDSDFDTLDDYYEAANGLDPQKADSNDDGLVDNLEIQDVALDLDDDSIPNVWDPDNDNDSVPDSLDSSPFTSSSTRDSFHFDVQTNGNPTYIDFQLRPENAEHLKLPLAIWDWPTDTEGQMQDRDGSVEDVQVLPMLELTLDSRPEQSEVEDYGIVVPEDSEDTERFVTHGITIADVDRNGASDLILFGGEELVDSTNPGYIIGWDLGEPTEDSFAPPQWSPLKKQKVYEYMGAGKIIDLTGNGKPEILVPRVGAYSLGSTPLYYNPISFGADLDTYGNQDEDLWNGRFRNLSGYSYGTGSGLDVADINGNGTPDVLMTYVSDFGDVGYMIGWDPDFEYDTSYWHFGLADKWSYSWPFAFQRQMSGDYNARVLPSIPIARGTFSHVAVKIADIDGNGTLDWLLMGTDSGADQLHYIIGWNMNTSGEPESWSDIETSPQIGGGLAGGGTVATDFNDNGTLDLLLLAVDDAETHSFHYTIGWDLDTNGNPGSWSSVYKQGTIRDKNVYVPLTPVLDLGTNVALSGRMFLPANSVEDISIDAKLVWIINAKTDDEDGISVSTMLAKYYEGFMLTSFIARENYGTQGSLVFSENRDQTIAAGFVMTYEFLRTQSLLTDMPDKLEEYEISSESQIMHSQTMSYPHQDAAIVGLTSEMTEVALDMLPEGNILPIIFAIEDDSASMEISDLGSVSEAGGFSIDLCSAPIVTTKMFQMNWYDTTSKQAVELDTVVTKMSEWGIEPDALENAMKTVVAWNAGDATVTRIGPDEIEFLTPEKSEILSTLSEVKSYGLKAIKFSRALYGVYKFFKTMPKITNVSSSSLKGIIKGVKQVIKDIKVVKVGKLGKLNSVVKYLRIAGDLLALGTAFYSFFDVSASYGWSTLGVAWGFKALSYDLAYGLVIVGLAAIPVIGWFLALGLVISDLIGGWFGDILQDIFNWMGGYEARSEVDLEVGESSFSYDDYDGNGLDIGDRIDLQLNTTEKIKTVNDGNFNDLWWSSFNVDFQCLTNNTQDQNTESRYIGGDYTDTTRYYTYDNLFWAETNKAMINFPWKIWINYNYKIFADECIFGFCDRVYFKDSGKSDTFTVYLDVLPGSLDDFLTWNAITPLDPDGDELWTSSGDDPNPNQYDTDGDGLSDGFEVLSSLNPSNEDPDSDGLSDLQELRLGTDPGILDTDGDGLSDGEEYQGWDITFTYNEQQFTSHVSSDPLQIDTDGDDVSDFDEFKGPLWDCAQGNPRSQDTNGNGIKDRLNVMPVIFIDSEINITEGEELVLLGYFTDSDPDTWTATVDYGDGSGTQPLNLNPDKTFSLNHVYTDNDIYTANITISDGSFSVSNASVIITVVNVSPTVSAGDDLEIYQGQTLNLTAGFTDPGVNDMPWNYTIDWGDGPTITTGSSDIQGANTIVSSHQYSDLGIYTITISVTDKDGGIGTDTLQVNVNKLQVKIDIKPSSDTNPINLNSNGVIPVAILSDNDFDASTVDIATVRFGPAEAAPVHRAMEDVDGDGDADMILHFRTQEVGLSEGDTEATLTGQTTDGIHFIGKDAARIVPPNDQPNPPSKDDAPGQNKEPGEPADGKGKSDAPGQNKEPREPANGKGKDSAPGQNKEPKGSAKSKVKD